MTDTTTAASAAAPAAKPTVGQELDAEIALLKARLGVLEADAKTDWAAVKAWVKANWPHFVTWATGAALAAKVGIVADIAKVL